MTHLVAGRKATMAEEAVKAEEPPADEEPADEDDDDEGEDEEEDGDEEDDEDEDDDDDDSDWLKNVLLAIGYGIIAFFIVTDPAGAAELGRDIGEFVGEQAASVIEFLQAAFSENATETP